MQKRVQILWGLPISSPIDYLRAQGHNSKHPSKTIYYVEENIQDNIFWVFFKLGKTSF